MGVQHDSIDHTGITGVGVGDATAHIGDTVDAHDASAISFTPVGTIAATDVQTAIAEVASEAAAGGIPATIFDAAGDIIVASAADTAARLAIGAANTVPKSNGTTLAYALPPGHEFDYVETATAATITATTEAGANTVITGSAVAYDGSTAVIIEFFAMDVYKGTTSLTLVLYDGASSIGQWTIATWNLAAHSPVLRVPVFVRRRLTPSNASHTYSVRAFVDAGTGYVGGSLDGTAGGAGHWMPSYIRITKA